jgi:hypothetical protein
MNEAAVEISRAGKSRLKSLASVFSRAFVDDPMMRWSILGDREPEDLLNLLKLCFTYFLEIALDLGLVWEAGDANAGAVWIHPIAATNGRSIPGVSHASSNSPMTGVADMTRSGTGSNPT